MSNIILRVAAKAVIVNNSNQVLVVREANTYSDGTQIGKYGIPGGRLDVGETYNDGLLREVMEETGLDVEVKYPIFVGEWHPEIKGVKHQIIAIFTICKAKKLNIILSEEHDDYKWIGEEDLSSVVVMDPDDKVLARFFKAKLSL